MSGALLLVCVQVQSRSSGGGEPAEAEEVGGVVEVAGSGAWSTPPACISPYPYRGRGAGITAVDYHQAAPAVVTEAELVTADPVAAAGAVWRRLGCDDLSNHPALRPLPIASQLGCS